MSEREKAIALLERIPDYKMAYVVGYLQGLSAGESAEVPNATTVAALEEVNEMIRTGSGQHFEGTAADFFAMLDREEGGDA